MTVLVKRDATGETVVDCGPVEEYERLLLETIESGKPHMVELFELENAMEREQLRQLASSLTSLVEHYARLWKYSFTHEHTEMVEQMRALKQKAKEQGVELWPELGE